MAQDGDEGRSIVGKVALGEMVREGLFSLVREEQVRSGRDFLIVEGPLQWGVSAGSVTVVYIRIF